MKVLDVLMFTVGLALTVLTFALRDYGFSLLASGIIGVMGLISYIADRAENRKHNNHSSMQDK